MWRLSGEKIIRELAEGEIPEGLVQDLEVLASTHLIVRTDVRGGHETLMRKMIQSNKAHDVLTFLQKAAEELLSSNINPEFICFLAHRYIAARGCAWTYASPERSSVLIDSTWGLLDGLAWLPHDTAVFDTASGQFRRTIDAKTTILDPVAESTESGDSVAWNYRETPTEWVWRSSLSNDQMHTAATGAKRLADHLDRPLILMWFIGLLDDSQIDCLPWFIAPDVPDLFSGKLPDSASRREVVRSNQDIDRLSSGIQGTKPVLSLQPESELVRDKEFIDKIITLTKEHELSVEIIGSPLSHPFYLLQSAGVPVTCAGMSNSPSIEYAKLVRDGIPEIIADNGENPTTYQAVGTERSRIFRTKVVEEALELQAALSEDQTLEEMADLLEVLAALRRELEITQTDVARVQKEKRDKRGGFDRGIVLVRTRRPGISGTRTSQDMLPGLESLVETARPKQVRNSGGKLLVNNVPPSPGERTTFTESLAGVKVTVNYTSSGIEFGLANDYQDETDLLPWEAVDDQEDHNPR